jgi:hypothetical protein
VTLLVGDDFDRLFTGFEHTAFRLQVRDRYDMPDERDDFARFLAGHVKTLEEEAEDLRPWLDMVRDATSAGKRLARVRVVTEPWSDYIRFEANSASLNIEVGEDIRYLPRNQAADLDLPDHDFWLFDSCRVAILHFSDMDQLLGAEVIEDASLVVRHCYWRDVAWHHAVPYAGPANRQRSGHA